MKSNNFSSKESTPESPDRHERQPVDDVHKASHLSGTDLSAFHIDDLSLETIDPEAEKKTKEHQTSEPYSGVERRKDQRREHDRRDMIRFEPDNKHDRRKKDRRKSDSVWTKYHADI